MDMSVWFLVGAILVFFMQCGFAMVETGFTRAKNAGNIIMKNLMDFCIGTIVFIFLGYGLMMGNHGRLGLIGVPDWRMFTDFNGFDWSSFVFQLVFCATAATIVSGAMAERTRFSAYCLYSAIISLIVYPVQLRFRRQHYLQCHSWPFGNPGGSGLLYSLVCLVRIQRSCRIGCGRNGAYFRDHHHRTRGCNLHLHGLYLAEKRETGRLHVPERFACRFGCNHGRMCERQCCRRSCHRNRFRYPCGSGG